MAATKPTGGQSAGGLAAGEQSPGGQTPGSQTSGGHALSVVRRPLSALMTGVVLLIALAGLTAGIAMNTAKPFTYGLDTWWAEHLGNGNQHGFPAIIFESLGGIGAFIVTLVVVAALLVWRHWRSAIFALVTLMAGPMLVEALLKPFVERQRPFQVLPGLIPPSNVNPNSFPSGHCASAAALAIVLVAVLPRAWRWWTWVIAAVIMLGTVWQRTMCNAHWLSDAVAGVLVGAGVALILWWAFYTLIRRDFTRAQERRQIAAQAPSADVSQ